MKGLYRYLSPFSPDQSGAVAVLYELGGIIVILDAGGCAGNICGFDEPRWGHKQSAVYSAGIRDLDAILGRDERTINKVGGAVDAVGNANFIALIGTPVPAVVGTDLKALARMCEKKFGLPTLAIETYGMHYYDKGAALAYLTLIKALESGTLDASFAALGLQAPSEIAAERKHTFESSGNTGSENAETGDASSGSAEADRISSVGVLGATPLDLLSLDGAELICQRVETKTAQQNLLHHRLRTGEMTSPFRHVVRQAYEDNKPDVYVFGMDCGFDELAHLFTVDCNVVVSPAGLKPARYLEQHYGIPFEITYPIGHELAVSLHERICNVAGGLGEITAGNETIVIDAARAEPTRTEAILTTETSTEPAQTDSSQSQPCLRVQEANRPLKVLILHQQVVANSLREALESLNSSNHTLNELSPEERPRQEATFTISVGTFFEWEESIARGGDHKFSGEDEFLRSLKDESFDVILGDPMYRMALKWWDGTFLPLPQYSVSGEAHEVREEKEIYQ